MHPDPFPAVLSLAARFLALALMAETTVTALQAQPTRPVFPGTETLRALQLKGLACSRENSTAICREVREEADNLLDNPLLTASCKDVLWELTQVAEAATVNDFRRRDRIDTAASRLTRVCRRPDRRRRQTPVRPGGPGGAGPS